MPIQGQEEYDDLLNEKEALQDRCYKLEEDLEKADDKIEKLTNENHDLQNELDKLVAGIRALV